MLSDHYFIQYKRIDEMHQIIRRTNGINAKFDLYDINVGETEIYCFIDIVFCRRDAVSFSEEHTLPNLRRQEYPSPLHLQDVLNAMFHMDCSIFIWRFGSIDFEHKLSNRQNISALSE